MKTHHGGFCAGANHHYTAAIADGPRYPEIAGCDPPEHMFGKVVNQGCFMRRNQRSDLPLALPGGIACYGLPLQALSGVRERLRQVKQVNQLPDGFCGQIAPEMGGVPI